jgi:hypothetical protein
MLLLPSNSNLMTSNIAAILVFNNIILHSTCPSLSSRQNIGISWFYSPTHTHSILRLYNIHRWRPSLFVNILDWCYGCLYSYFGSPMYHSTHVSCLFTHPSVTSRNLSNWQRRDITNSHSYGAESFCRSKHFFTESSTYADFIEPYDLSPHSLSRARSIRSTFSHSSRSVLRLQVIKFLITEFSPVASRKKHIQN